MKPIFVVDDQPAATTPHARRPLSLARARDSLQSQLDNGVICPCCGQDARRYQRKLNATMALGLLEHYRLSPALEFVDATRIKNALAHLDTTYPTSDYAKLRYWNLIEGDTEPGRKSFWRITTAGARFLRRELSVPRFALVYNGRVEGFSTEMTDIVGALDDRFSYAELMARS